ncbi:processed acidic surface protein [Alkalicoccobacillus gibsonii]|uniref:processed acidic surface protein n=1 Tax=Alkalicoccobacillus gibsonii TaxID=79881 RepID=UPI00193450E6|nr:processed acidic surface protein [Alkalicoccobacillus gibsonii]MBM0065804.1 processed acidic surface protein [Alkalicoccobacillus gibsonii]
MKRFVSMFLVIALLFLAVPSVGFAAVTDEELEGLLVEKNITREQLDYYLSEFFESSVDEFETIDDLDWFIWVLDGEDSDGTPYLEYILDYFEITYDELVALLSENNKVISDFTFNEELEYYLWDHYEWDFDWDEEWTEEEEWEEISFDGLFDEIGLSDKELEALFEHLIKVVEQNPEAVDQLLALAERMEAFGDFESSAELTAEEIAELFAIGNELIKVLQINPEFYLAKPGEQKPISFADLLKLTELKGYDLLVVLYDLEGNKLADFIITAELFNGNTLGKVGEDIGDTGAIVEDVVENKPTTENKPAPTPAAPAKTKAEKEEKVAKENKTAPAKQSEPKKDNTPSKKVTKTVDGAKMPKTATDYPLYTFIGLGMTLVGFILFRRFKMAS